MAISSAIATSFKTQVLTGTHNFTASSGNTFKLALYTALFMVQTSSHVLLFCTAMQ